MEKYKSIISEMRNTIRNTFVRAVNVFPWREMDKISAGQLRGGEKLHHLEDEAGTTQKELADLENRKIAAKK